jgi:hypothetical protein
MYNSTYPVPGYEHRKHLAAGGGGAEASSSLKDSLLVPVKLSECDCLSKMTCLESKLV